MAEDQKNEVEKEVAAETGSNDGTARISCANQYIKDLSVENPEPLRAFSGSSGEPSVQVAINVNSSNVGEDLYEVTLRLKADAKNDNVRFFTIELEYAGLFKILNIESSRVEQILMIDCAAMLFPFARAVIANSSRDAGYAPLMLDPVNFQAMFLDSLAKREQQATAAASDDTPSVSGEVKSEVTNGASS